MKILSESLLTLDADISAVLMAAEHWAEAVDHEARFPIEAVELLRRERLLSCALPTTLGGKGATITQLAELCRLLGSACAATGLVFAMHHTQSLIFAHFGSCAEVAELAHRICSEEMLIASATSEVGTGGDIRKSKCAATVDKDTVVLHKVAPVISYGEYADLIMATARRTPESSAGDQVLVACHSDHTKLDKIRCWNAFGMRGTCSHSYNLRAEVPAAAVLPLDFSTVCSVTMLPAAHVLWGHVWLGIADAAVEKAAREVRAAVRASSESGSRRAAALAELLVHHQSFTAAMADGLRLYAAFLADGKSPTIGLMISMNNLKILASKAVVNVVSEALNVCGINGYREDHSAAMGRHLRDAYGAQLMVSNDRIQENTAQLVLAHRVTL